MKEEFDIAKIIAAILSGKITEEELKKLAEWQQLSARNSLLYNKILKKENIRAAGALLHKFNKQEGWGNIQKQLPAETRIIRKNHFWRKAGQYAAILMICIISWFIFNSREQALSTETKTVQISASVQSASPQGVTLKLADGTSINLKEKNGPVKLTTGEAVINNTDKLLSYRDILPSGNSSPEYNEIYVARGEIFQLELCDGSRIHLNSMSKIKYPVIFTSTTREIELEGEAYLEINKDPEHPFVVKTRDFDIRVLGTKFNVCAYPEDYRINTTLIEGAVQVESPKFNVLTTLKPNEQLRFNKMTLEQTVEKVDVSYSIAWLEGKLRFRDIQLGEFMNILQRWYDIKVNYDTPEARNLIFGGNFNRTDSIDELLEIIEQTKKVSISRSGKHLRISIPTR